MVKRPGNFFDFCIVVACVIDDILVKMLISVAPGITQGNLSLVSTIRAFRLLRLARLLRAFRLFPKLQMLASSLNNAQKYIALLGISMLIFIYGTSLYCVQLVHASSDESSILMSYFGNLTSAMVTVWQLATFDSWGEIIENMLDEGYILGAASLVCTMFVLGCGILNMAIGVLCGSAMTLSESERKEREREELVAFFSCMARFQMMVETELGTEYVAQEIFQRAFDIKIRPRRVDARAQAPEGYCHSAENGDAENSRALTIGMSTRFIEKMQHYFMRADLTSENVKRVFEKVDYMRSGYITVDAFTKGALAVKEDITKIDVYASTILLRSMQTKTNEISALMGRMHEQLESAIGDVSALIRHETPSRNGESKRTQEKAETGNAHQYGVSAWVDESLNHIQARDHTGDMDSMIRLMHGQGLVKLNGFNVVGQGTMFLIEVAPGDLIILQVDGATRAVVVHSVPSQTLLKITKAERASEPSPFYISRNCSDVPLVNLGHDTSLVPEMSLAVQDSPRSTQQFFEWEVATKDRELRRLHREKVHLKMQVLLLERDRVRLAKTICAKSAFVAWKDARRRARGTRRRPTAIAKDPFHADAARA